MIDGGYFAKQVVSRPEWLNAPGVREICSTSNCVSPAPDGWIDRWLHNEFGWFNRASDAAAVIPPERTELFRVFAYRIHPELFRNGHAQSFVLPADVHPDAIPRTFQSLGFDSVSKSSASVLGFECSPLSCNGMANEIAANEYCLFDSLEAAIAGASRFSVEQPEPGDYYVIEVLEARRVA